MKQKLKCQTHKKLHTKKLCKMILVTIIYSLLLCSCFAKSSSDNTTTKETITGLLKEQKETPSDSIKKKVKKLLCRYLTRKGIMKGNDPYLL